MRNLEMKSFQVFLCNQKQFLAFVCNAIFASKNDTMDTCRTYGGRCTYEEKSSGYIRTDGV